ncbi:pregnancy-specific beta-1-glycoprotein 4-like isoform X2 [Monodelphis domestica]|uniref:pregnancy-specific beta-1-glycoprotein 4-like isoform X2 n=1 Tax=Monodelphis domestica TaxID=13616 RepID=UPI0024E1DBB0|nr:pregnancy-specific beta-1-glycoprotein 4-like isoform X2 [Monodelphis domestica]
MNEHMKLPFGDFQRNGPWPGHLLTAFLLCFQLQLTPAELTITPIPSRPVEGENITLFVQGFIGEDLMSFNWFRGSTTDLAQQILTFVSMSGTQSMGKAYTGRERAEADGSLHISSSHLNDSGIYTIRQIFFPTDSGSNMVSTNVYLPVYDGPDPPVLRPEGSDFVVGSNLTLSCFASSNPAAHYIWWVNGTAGPSGQQLFIPNISGGKSEVYACHATNPDSGLHSTAEIAVSISETLTQPGVLVNNSGPVENKDSVNLTCVPPKSLVAIVWFNDGEILLSGRQGLGLSPDNRILTLEVVTRNDSDLYQCEARNPDVASTRAPITLKVIYGPDIPIVTPPNSTFVEGYALTISCFSDSNPAAQYTWEIDGTPEPSTQHLSIPDVSLDNSGVYTCEASHIITHQRSTAQARIQVSEREWPPLPCDCHSWVAGHCPLSEAREEPSPWIQEAENGWVQFF